MRNVQTSDRFRHFTIRLVAAHFGRSEATETGRRRLYSNWAGKELEEGGLLELLAVGTPDQYRSWAVRLAKSVSKEWKHRLGYDLGLSRALKLINLLAKGLCIVAPLWPDQYGRLVWNIEVPLDKYSLRPLACIPELANVGVSWRTASMGSVRNLKMYSIIQDSIRAFCGRAGVPPLAYDFLAWDVPHDKDSGTMVE